MERLSKLRTLIGLLLLTACGFLIHGYHPYAEDAEIYLPGILKILNPSLYPLNTDFFGEHAGHTLYPKLIAASVRLTHISLAWMLLLWQWLSILLLLAGTWRLVTALFEDSRARWAAVALMTALLTIPIAGTDLYILDQYPNPRNLAAFAALFAIAELLRRRYLATLIWLAFAAAMHPFMAGFAILFCAWVFLVKHLKPRLLRFAAALPFGLTLAPPPAAYHEVALRQPAHFILRWEWYEWLGIVGPMLLFAWFARIAHQRTMRNIELLSRAVIPFILVAMAAAIALSSSPRFEALARLQPTRSLAIVYMLLVVIGGGFLGQFVLQERVWRWSVLFVPLSLGMFFAQRQLFPASAHVEWPGAQPRNAWAQAFDWIRLNTPTDALFALDPNHMELDGEDQSGFRARAERSMLADAVKDKGAASMFPPLSVEWLEQYNAQKDWKHFHQQDFERLRAKYGVTWVVLQQPGLPGINCPYSNAAVEVCQVR